MKNSKNIYIIIEVFKKQKDSLIVVGSFAVGYVVISALIIFLMLYIGL